MTTPYTVAELDKLQERWQAIIQQSKKTQVYKDLLKRRFRNPHGFIPWEQCAGELAAVVNNVASIGVDSIDHTAKTLVSITARFCSLQAPVYWLRPALAEALWNSDLPAQLPALEQVLPVGVLMLPDVPWSRDPEGFRPRYVLVQHLMANEHIGRVPVGDGTVSLNAATKDLLMWAMPLPTGGAYAKNSALLGDWIDTDTDSTEWLESTNVMTEQEHEWSNRITRLVYQSLLLLQLKPDWIDIPTTTTATTTTGKRKLTKKERMLNPRWIGAENFRVKTATTNPASSGDHASPTAHWRRGHWRRTPVGEGGKDRKLSWIQPTLVNP
ncbi:MAG: hypothetical protein AAGH78_00120 [Cyanobacteria bacterium P01_H01_bin.58]